MYRTEETLAFGRHSIQQFGMGFPPVPAAADGIVAVEYGDAVSLLVGPRRSGVRRRFGKNH